MKILFLGDTHGNYGWCNAIVRTAKKHDIDWIVQCGDFGYWEHKRSGVDFLFVLQKDLAELGQQLVWIDGNHENHTLLREKFGPGGWGLKEPHPEYGFWQIRDNIWYAPRGHRWTWDTVDFMAMGGAYSIDKEWRKPGVSWWPEELITEEEVETAIAGGLVDLMVTHDCPDGTQNTIPLNGGVDRKKDAFPPSLENRRKLARIVHAVKPYALVHGHYHHRNTEMLSFPTDTVPWNVLIEGLACDEMNGSALIWTTEELPRRDKETQ